jgi:tRNA (cytosine38-C5)-methyltransferase
LKPNQSYRNDISLSLSSKTTTRNAKKKDSDDERCKGFKAIIELLRTIEDKPRWIMVENVKGFVGSHMLSLWHECLHDCGYTYEEYLLSPTQLKIPNHRTRYYMICERSNRFQCRTRHKEDLNVSPLPGCIPDSEFADKKVRPISFYLNTNEIGTKEFEDLKIPDCVFEKKWAKQLPVVSPLDRATHCFTAAYGRQIHRATGSLLLMDSSRATSIADTPLDRTDMTQYKSKLRRFSPRELLRIFCFPDDLKFPDDISLEHQYKLIGNSVNVCVISHVASFLLKDFTTLSFK